MNFQTTSKFKLQFFKQTRMPYTNLTNQSLQQTLQQFNIAPLVKWKILKGGSANSNYLIETTEQKFPLILSKGDNILNIFIISLKWAEHLLFKYLLFYS